MRFPLHAPTNIDGCKGICDETLDRLHDEQQGRGAHDGREHENGHGFNTLAPLRIMINVDATLEVRGRKHQKA